MDESLARLRASRDQIEQQHHAEGVAFGKTWALDRAEHDELERVAKIDDEVFGQSPADLWGALLLAGAILDEKQPGNVDISEQMEMLFGRESPTLAQIQGFIEGAREVYEQV